MTSIVKIGMCQIPLSIYKDPFEIANLEEHTQIVQKCFEIADEHSVDYLVFPEYTYHESLKDLYIDKSYSYDIIGGSLQSEDNFNETIIAIDGDLYRDKKRYLSPYEIDILASRKVQSWEGPPFVTTGKSNHQLCILTCFDYVNLYYDVGRKQLDDGSNVNFIFSPCCNNKPDIFFRIAEALHIQRDELYSIICNVSQLTIYSRRNNSPTESYFYGESCLFGLYDPISRASFVEKGLTDKHFHNMIARLSKKENSVCIFEIRVPYSLNRRSSAEFNQNPMSFHIQSIEGD